MSRRLSFFEHFFSLINYDYCHKQLCILGIKIKIPMDVKKHLRDRKYFHNMPIQNNKIVFRTFNGAYNCNPKYIAEEILKQNLPYDLVWIVNKNILKFIWNFPRNIRLVMAGTEDELKEFATAKIWIDNERRNYLVKKGLFKRDEQVYIQTFHGSLGIKRTGIERNNPNSNALKVCMIDSEHIDYLISNGSYTSNFFKNMFWGNGKILEFGHPRNDIFYKNAKLIKDKVFSSLNIDKNKKIIMYAPTLREDKDMSPYSLDYEKIINAACKKFGSDFVMVTRLHPLMLAYKNRFYSDNKKVIDATEYSDMQELLTAADILITDYSSCIYDYMLQYKPGFIFATDVEKYENNRGLYYPLSTTPFPVAKNNNELIKAIENFDYEKYKKEVKTFLDGKGCIDDGHASERVVELIKEIISVAESKIEKEEVAV